ncbi:MAG: 4-hydroxy-tetrahydrodipicolinate synthase [Flavobacteriia bacterium]|nr:4-hydroxy-tetrahydrodipicolinate synthase [Flavobacteriia bacterium]
MNNEFLGSGVALVTPFDASMQVDFDALKRLVEFQVDNGTDFLVVQGTTGESPTLSMTEKQAVLATVLEVNDGRLSVVYGLGGNNTANIAELLEAGLDEVDGILSVTPYYNKPTQQGLLAHYRILADSTDLPIILYNVPGRTGTNLSAETTLELSEINNIVAVKEASGNMEQIMQIIKHRPEGFGVLSGDDNLTLPLIAAGADGVISVVANAFPALFSSMVHNALEGKFELARKAHYALFEITKMLFEQGNPGGVKSALAHLEIMEDFMRLPLYPISEELKQRIEKEVDRILG